MRYQIGFGPDMTRECIEDMALLRVLQCFMVYAWDLMKWVSAAAVGPVGYFIVKHTGAGDSIWGNSADGLSGDDAYREKEAKRWFRRYWPSFWWSVVRNPANNLARSFASGIVTEVHHDGQWHFATIDGKRVFFFYSTRWPVLIKLGYKLWDNESLSVGREYTAKLAFSIQRRK